MKSHFFISRAGEDSEYATWIAGVLHAAGHNTTIQEDFGNGSVLHHIQRGMDSADRFIAVLSQHYLDKPYTRAELHSAVTTDPDGAKGLIIPVRIGPCDLPHPIKDYKYVDFVGKDETQRTQALLKAAGHAGNTSAAFPVRTSIQKLPTVDPHVFGREAEFKWLEEAWSNPQTNFVQIIAPGGAGKRL